MKVKPPPYDHIAFLFNFKKEYVSLALTFLVMLTSEKQITYSYMN